MMRLAGYVERRLNRTTTLRHELRQHWVLPEEEQFHSRAPDWLLPLLSSVHAEAKAKTLLLLWRACQLRNDIMFGKGTTSIAGSVKFLINYGESLKTASHTSQLASVIKGRERFWTEPG
jgi:hypothetical protein